MGSKVAFVAIFTKFGGKKPFCKLLKDLSSGFAFFYIELPVRPLGGAKGVKWGSKVTFAPIFTKFGGKEPFCKLLKDLSSNFDCFNLSSPFDP